LRNIFIHRGESFFNGKSLFFSNDCRDLDSLNPEILADIEDGAPPDRWRSHKLSRFCSLKMSHLFT
jgi:hypothetical protein